MRIPSVGLLAVATVVACSGPAAAQSAGRAESLFALSGLGGSALIVASSGGSDNIPRAMLNVCVAPALAGFAVGAIIDAVRN